MRLLIGFVLVLVAVLVVAWIIFAGPSHAAVPPMGVAINLPEGGTANDIGREVMAARSGGARLMVLSHKWSELEPSPGKFDLKSLHDAIPPLSNLGFSLAVTIATLDTNNKTLPADLQSEPFDSPKVRTRFDTLLRAIAKELSPSVKWVMLGNEADIYLGIHQDEQGAFAGFVEAGRKTLKSLQPGVKVGVTTTFDGLRDRPDVFHRLNRDTDVITMTYYPLRQDMMARPTSDVGKDIGAMVEAAGTRPLLLQELGYPASETLGSSEQKQADFVDAVFDAIAAQPKTIVGGVFFIEYDFDQPTLDTLTGYYHIDAAPFRAFLGTLGLKKSDGTPRKAWGRYEARLKAWNSRKG